MQTVEKAIFGSRAANFGKKATLLAVACGADHASFLRGVLGRNRWQVEAASTCKDAIHRIRALQPDVILCQRVLPDGDWRDLLRVISAEGSETRLIVASRLADDTLWAEVLNLGGYDVLLEPFRPEEVSRVVENCHPEWAKPEPKIV